MIENDFQLQNTLDKLAALEEHLQPKLALEAAGTLTPVQRLSLRSMRRMMNQLREEIVRYRSSHGRQPAEESALTA